MSGGGNKVAKGRMSSKLRPEVSPQQLQQLEQTLQDQEKSAEVGQMIIYIATNFMFGLNICYITGCASSVFCHKTDSERVEERDLCIGRPVEGSSEGIGRAGSTGEGTGGENQRPRSTASRQPADGPRSPCQTGETGQAVQKGTPESGRGCWRSAAGSTKVRLNHTTEHQGLIVIHVTAQSDCSKQKKY